jgi:hypothetical protein
MKTLAQQNQNFQTKIRIPDELLVLLISWQFQLSLMHLSKKQS